MKYGLHFGPSTKQAVASLQPQAGGFDVGRAEIDAEGSEPEVPRDEVVTG